MSGEAPPESSNGGAAAPPSNDLRELQAIALAHRAALEEALFGAYEESTRDERESEDTRVKVAKIERKAAINARRASATSQTRRRRSSRLAGVEPTVYNPDGEFDEGEDNDDDDFEGDDNDEDFTEDEGGGEGGIGGSSKKKRRRRSSGAGGDGSSPRRRWGESSQQFSAHGYVPKAPRDGIIKSRPVGPRDEGSNFACHWCRHPRNMEWLRCAVCRSVLFCSRCYGARHCTYSKREEQLREALDKKASWICPPCRGACNCSGQGSKAHLYKLTGNLPSGSMASIVKSLDKDVNTILETTEWQPPNASYVLPKIQWPGRTVGRHPWPRYDQEYLYQLDADQVRDLSHIYAWLPDAVVLSRVDNNVAPWTDAEIAIITSPHTDVKTWTDDWPTVFAQRVAQIVPTSPPPSSAAVGESSSASSDPITAAETEVAPLTSSASAEALPLSPSSSSSSLIAAPEALPAAPDNIPSAVVSEDGVTMTILQ
jgi:hypothetical protein